MPHMQELKNMLDKAAKEGSSKPANKTHKKEEHPKK
jgi:hypothetical protein